MPEIDSTIRSRLAQDSLCVADQDIDKLPHREQRLGQELHGHSAGDSDPRALARQILWPDRLADRLERADPLGNSEIIDETGRRMIFGYERTIRQAGTIEKIRADLSD